MACLMRWCDKGAEAACPLCRARVPPSDAAALYSKFSQTVLSTVSAMSAQQQATFWKAARRLIDLVK